MSTQSADIDFEITRDGREISVVLLAHYTPAGPVPTDPCEEQKEEEIDIESVSDEHLNFYDLAPEETKLANNVIRRQLR